MPQRQDPVVASVATRSDHPYSAIAMSPSRKYAVVAGKDTLQLVRIDRSGLRSLRSLKISQHFIGVAPTDGRSTAPNQRYGDVRDAFGLAAGKQATARPNMAHAANIVVTCVAWSMPPSEAATARGIDGADLPVSSSMETAITQQEAKNTTIAVAASNGVVVIWSARQAFFAEDTSAGSSSASMGGNNQQPEAILNQHTRAVNSLAWHPKRPGLLLTASQDATVKLWERRDVGPQPGRDVNKNLRSWFGGMGMNDTVQDKTYTWYCRATFEPKSEAVREIKWSKFNEDIFGLVTVSGSLIVYSMHLPAKAIVKIAAHTGDATSLDWHPIQPFILATGGAGDRTVKVWNLESSLAMKKDDAYASLNMNTTNTIRSEVSGTSEGSSETDKSGLAFGPASTIGSGSFLPVSARSIGATVGSSGRFKSGLAQNVHVLSIASSVTKIKWRPPALDSFPVSEEDTASDVDRHEAMLAVATARLTSAGGAGVLSLWSIHRPFMPLSVVEGHTEGAVADFAWIDTPQIPKKKNSRKVAGAPGSSQKNDGKSEAVILRGGPRGSGRDIESILFETREEKELVKRESSDVHIWQHVLSVGRDGRCILQSFARGDRPMSRVPSSCFAMANLSPFFFQSGCGSLQVFSVYQRVPQGRHSDFLLTGLRQDEYTMQAPGVFREVPLSGVRMDEEIDEGDASDWVAGKRLPNTIPDVIFNVLDQDDLDDDGLPLGVDESRITLAPEVLHLSRFAELYRLHPDNDLKTRLGLCLYNGDVAEKLRRPPVARMWRSVASMLSGSGLDELPPHGVASNAMQFALLPSIRSLLEERAEAGDVQTCVALCEVLQVIHPDQKTRIPGLELNLVREWYLSYIDLLHQMCLFSSASHLIRNSQDKFIGALNQQSTTIHESCPRCGKMLEPPSDGVETTARRACKNCRRRVGLCFLCHSPVTGMYVWCPGCSHGGHLEHALQWFGGMNGKPVREECPTGCGHRCNLHQMLSAFPRTDSVMCLPVQEDLVVAKSG